MLQVREMRFHCANVLVVLRIWAPLGVSVALLQKMRVFGSNASFSLMLLYTYCYINQGWANLFNGRVICRKQKTPASRKTSL